MDPKELKRLLESVKESGISELVLETPDYKLSVKRGGEVQYVSAPPTVTPQTASQTAPVSAMTPPATPAPQAAPVPQTLEPALASPAAAPASNLVDIVAPIVGTLYAASGPDAPPFVKVGDRVQAGSVLCIIEAMKLMNEIEAEVGGVVREILVKNEEPVEYGQALFRLEPA